MIYMPYLGRHGKTHQRGARTVRVNIAANTMPIDTPTETSPSLVKARHLPVIDIRITHSDLRVQKSRKDCKALKYQDSPIQGTCLDNHGKSPPDQLHKQPKKLNINLFDRGLALTQKLPSFVGRARFFPNRFIAGNSSTQIIFTDTSTIKDLKPSNSGSINYIRAENKKNLTDRDYIKAINGYKPKEKERINFRYIISCYWENSSLFQLDLVDTVVR